MTDAPTKETPANQGTEQLAEHSIIICVERRERALALESLFKHSGIVVHLATTVYDALRLAEQELPHLVITEPNFTDGTASILIDRLKAHRHLQRIPVALLVTKLSKEEAAALVKRSLAGLFPASMDRRLVVEKSLKILQSVANVSGSPHFIPWGGAAGSPRLDFFAESTFFGRFGPFVVCRSSSAVGTSEPVRCLLKSAPDAPVLMTATTNFVRNDGVLSLFPLHRLQGQVHSLLGQLPDLSGGGAQIQVKAQGRPARNVLLVSENVAEVSAWQKILAAYNWNLTHAPNAAGAAVLLGKFKVSALWLALDHGKQEVPVEVTSALSALPPLARPVILMHAEKSGFISKDQICYLAPGFGLGNLLDALESTLGRSGDFGEELALSGQGGLGAEWAGAGEVLGCDERSWYLRADATMARGTRVTIHQPSRGTFWTSLHLIVGSGMAGADGKFLLRLDVVAAGASKLKYWEKVIRDLNLEAA